MEKAVADKEAKNLDFCLPRPIRARKMHRREHEKCTKKTPEILAQ